MSAAAVGHDPRTATALLRIVTVCSKEHASGKPPARV